jgi:hypothetical protein
MTWTLCRVDPPETIDSSDIFALDGIDLEAVDLAEVYVTDGVNMKAKQMEDPWIRKIVSFIEHVERLSDNEENPVPPVSHIEDFSLQNGILYVANFDPEGRSWRLVVPKGMRKEVLTSLHANELCGHFGMTRTWILVKSRFYWKGIYRDTRRYVLGCKVCQIHRVRRGPESGPMQTFDEVSVPFQRVGIDFVGPFVRSTKGNKHALIFVDHFSRYCESVPVPAATAESVVQAIKHKIILRHSLPKEFFCDRGRQFISNLVKEMKVREKFETNFSAPHNPQTNGMTER